MSMTVSLCWQKGEFIKMNLTAKEVDEKFDNGKALTDFFTEVLDPKTYQTEVPIIDDGIIRCECGEILWRLPCSVHIK
jgi:hypothetical protein